MKTAHNLTVDDNGSGLRVSRDGRLLCTAVTPAIALEIQTCLNSHQALVEALKDCAGYLEAIREVAEFVGESKAIASKLTIARKALAMASGGGK